MVMACENKIVNINEAYSTIQDINRINNVIATLKSDEVNEYIVNDKKNQLEFKSLYSQQSKNVFSRIFTKKTIVNNHDALNEELHRTVKPGDIILIMTNRSSVPIRETLMDIFDS